MGIGEARNGRANDEYLHLSNRLGHDPLVGHLWRSGVSGNRSLVLASEIKLGHYFPELRGTFDRRGFPTPTFRGTRLAAD